MKNLVLVLFSFIGLCAFTLEPIPEEWIIEVNENGNVTGIYDDGDDGGVWVCGTSCSYFFFDE